MKRKVPGSLNHQSATDIVTTSNGSRRQHGEARRKLPVYKYRAEICNLVAENDAVLVIAETGSGKSTQIPAYLQESACLRRLKHKKQSKRYAKSICVTQPRRVAAMTVAQRVAQELGCEPGTLVGHRVRFDDCTDVQGRGTTQIIYATDGMLLREATADPLLTRYAAVVLDEAHERSLQTDILFGVVKRAMEARGAVKGVSSITNTQKEKQDLTRDEIILNLMRTKAKEFNLPPLHIVVMSATLDVQTFTAFLPHAKCIKVPGRTFPVQTLYTKDPQEDYIDAALLTALQIHYYEEEGDILIFLPGQEDIETLSLLLKKHLEEKSQLAKELSNQQQGDVVQSIKGMGTDLNSGHAMFVNGVLICTLYAALPPEAQMFAFAPKPKGCSRKIILSTNIAETSVTLDGIVYVIDSGKFKSREYSAATGMETLAVSNISQAQANQRKGRAGRVSAGLCFRLYPEDAFCKLQETATPEILRVNLAQVVLQLKGMGIHDPRTFDFLTQPSTETLVKAFEQLYALGAVDNAMNLTPYGKKMAKLPLDPTSAHLLLQSSEFKCTTEMLTAVAMLSAENIFYRPGGNEGSIGSLSGKASAAHNRFASHEGDLPTFLFVYNCWKDEAFYISHKKPKGKNKPMKKIPHGEWCAQNFISGRSLVRAHDVRKQLTEICCRDEKKNGLGMDTTLSCGEEMEDFLKCVCSGLFLQSASRMINSNEINKANRKERKAGNESSVRGRYKTKIGGREVSIHPTSSLFGRNPPPKCVVYTELLETKRSYIRGVTQVKEEWLSQVAPSFFKA